MSEKVEKKEETQSERKTDILNFVFAYFLGVITTVIAMIISTMRFW